MQDDRNDQNRLLIATFVVATFIAAMQIQLKAVDTPSHYIVVLVGAPMVGLGVSALFAFLFVMAKGFELRYTSKSKDSLVDRWNHHLYNVSIILFAPTVIFIGGMYAYAILYPRAVAGDGKAMLILYLILIFIIILNNIHFVLKSVQSLWSSFLQFLIRKTKHFQNK